MATRKQTPDVLGDILSGGVTSPAAAQATVAPRPAARKASAAKAPAVPDAAGPTSWNYLVVSFQSYRGWRPRYRNGEELPEWTEQPLLHDYINRLGDAGWELCASAAGQSLYGTRDEYQVFFKRRA